MDAAATPPQRPVDQISGTLGWSYSKPPRAVFGSTREAVGTARYYFEFVSYWLIWLIPAALACERYRQRHKDWPASLDVLVKAKLLDADPLDPMDGRPLRYRRTKDGIVIYSIGIDKTDNQGHIDREHPIDPGVDLGFRLWDPFLRRQEARPPVGLPEVDQPARQR